jgi:hypothetical protein
LLFTRLQRAQESLATLRRDTWTAEFVQESNRVAATLPSEWDDTRRKECDAKRLFKYVQVKYQARGSVELLKAEVMKKMRVRQTDDWKILQTLIQDAISQSVTNAA